MKHLTLIGTHLKKLLQFIVFGLLIYFYVPQDTHHQALLLLTEVLILCLGSMIHHNKLKHHGQFLILPGFMLKKPHIDLPAQLLPAYQSVYSPLEGRMINLKY